MFKKKYLGYFLIVVGGMVGALAVLMNFISRGQLPVLLILLVLALGCVAVGTILAFSQLLDRLVQPVVEEISADLEDDIQEIKEKRFNNAAFMFACSGLIILVFLYFVLKLHKLEAAWGGMPVFIVAAVVVLIGTVVVVGTRWFQDQTLRTPLGIYFIPLVGFILALVLGLQTENQRAFSYEPVEGVVYNDFTPAAFDFLGNSILNSDGATFGCDDDACLVIVLVIALIVVTLVMVLGAASIPHFWFLSGMVFAAILVIITIHEIRVRRVLQAKPSPSPSLKGGEKKE